MRYKFLVGISMLTSEEQDLSSKSTQNKSQKVTIWPLDLQLSQALLSCHPDKVVTSYMISTIIEMRIKFLNRYLDGNCYVEGLWKSYAKYLEEEKNWSWWMNHIWDILYRKNKTKRILASCSGLLCIHWAMIDLSRMQRVQNACLNT